MEFNDTDEEMAVDWIRSQGWNEENLPTDEFNQMFCAYLAGLKTGSQLDRVWHDYDTGEDCYEDSHEGRWEKRETGEPKWHKIFKGDPCCVEYWDLPQDNLPKNENFYFVKLKNGYIKICELKYDLLGKRKCFYDLHGWKQSDVSEWLDYPTI